VQVRIENHQTNLGDTTLHNQEIRIVNIKLNALKQSLNCVLLGLVAIKQEFGNIW
jgi:hypothetical protein